MSTRSNRPQKSKSTSQDYSRPQAPECSGASALDANDLVNAPVVMLRECDRQPHQIKKPLKNDRQNDKQARAAFQRLSDLLPKLLEAYFSPESKRKDESGVSEFDELCDMYTDFAKGVAATVLAERIHCSFVDKIDPKSGKSTESAAEKILHAKEIRGFLSPWNLGFDVGDGKRVQIRAFAAGGENYGTYKLGPYDAESADAETARWLNIKSVVLNPKLVDVTDRAYRRNLG